MTRLARVYKLKVGGPVAQWQSNRLITGRSLVRTQPGPPPPSLSAQWTGPCLRKLFARLLLACNATGFLTFRSAGLSDEIRQASPVALSTNNSSTSSTKYRWAFFLAWLSGLLSCLACSGAGRMMPLKCSKVAVQVRSGLEGQSVTLGKIGRGRGCLPRYYGLGRLVKRWHPAACGRPIFQAEYNSGAVVVEDEGRRPSPH